MVLLYILPRKFRETCIYLVNPFVATTSGEGMLWGIWAVPPVLLLIAVGCASPSCIKATVDVMAYRYQTGLFSGKWIITGVCAHTDMSANRQRPSIKSAVKPKTVDGEEM